jgi:hypothetical protein
MLKNSAKIEIKMDINERSYQFFCDNNSPLGELYDALSSIRNFVTEKMKEIENKEQQDKANV